MDQAPGSLQSGEAHDPATGRPDPAKAYGVDFSLLFAQSPEILLVLLPDAPRFTMIAATTARLHATHLTQESFGRGLFEVFPDNPDDPAASGTSNLRASLERVLKTRQPDTMPVQKYDIRGADGEFEVKYWSPKNLPVLSPQGEVLYIFHRVEDVTELVRASELGDQMRGRTSAMEREVISRSRELDAALRKLRDSNLKLAELDAAKTVFFNNISHEFRTPLALILGTLEDELSSNSPLLPAKTRMQLKMAHRNSLRLLKLVNSLLDFSRIEAGRMQARYQATDLAVLTKELAGNFRSAIERGGLLLAVDCPPLPVAIYVDHDMWEKIVLNLLSNAFKHTFEGSITLKLAWLGDGVQLSVQDTGVGIAAENLPRLFDRFHRVEGAPSRTHEGSGIGLALVKDLVQLHSGAIAVESELGKGSRFQVTLKAGTAHLPTDKIDHTVDASISGHFTAAFVEEALNWSPVGLDSAIPGPPALIDPNGVSIPPTWTAPRAQILYADDNADMRSYVTHLLGRHYDVAAVPDGQAALEAALASPPDLVLSDVMMPRLDGFGLLRALRADVRTRRVPVIFVSARAGEESAIAGLDTGADDYLVKPFTARELLARVRTHVGLAWQRRSWDSELEQRVEQRTAELAAEIARRRATEASLEAQIQRLGLLDQITRAIAGRKDLGGILLAVVQNVEQNLPADVCWIGLPGAVTVGLALGGELLYEPDFHPEAINLPPELAGVEVRSLVIAPLRAEGDLLGVLLAGRREPDSFSVGEREFLRQLSEHVAIAARQGQLHESLQAAYDDLHLTQQTVLLQHRGPPEPATDPVAPSAAAASPSRRL